MSSQSTKERKAKENLVVLHNCSTYDTKFEGCYVESIRGGMCQAIHPFIIYYELECLLSKSKDYYKPIKTNKKKPIAVITYITKVTEIKTKIYH